MSSPARFMGRSLFPRRKEKRHRREGGALRRCHQPLLEQFEARFLLTTYLVTSTADSGVGTLRQAIQDSNGDTAAPNVIHFELGGGVPTITPLFALPPITHAVTIAMIPSLIPGHINGAQLELRGDSAGNGASGFVINAPNCAIEGFVINRFDGYGIFIDGASASGNVIQRDRIGTDAAGTTALPNGAGVFIADGASGNTIGSTVSTNRNVISGNNGNAITISGSGSRLNVVEGNYIGTDAAGQTQIPNTNGVLIASGAQNNTIGGLTTTPGTGAGNVFSGNSAGICISDSGTSGNVVEGNLIGTIADGTVALGNFDGVFVQSGATNNTIGGTTTTARNVISGNSGANIRINGTGTTGNTIEGNYVGTNAAGTAQIGSAIDGILIDGGASGTTIGGLTSTPGAGLGNVISGNTNGIDIQSGTNTVEGNLIGTTAAGTALLANNNGVEVLAVSGNTIGGTVAGAGNVISGNTGDGVLIAAGATNSLIEGNLIGTDITGTQGLGNGTGVQIAGLAQNNTVGGTVAGSGNVISGNSLWGVDIDDTGTTNNTVAGNLIGTDITGTVRLGNKVGVGLFSVSGNTIGGTSAAARNVISGNSLAGVRVQASNNNWVEGNYIGADETGAVAMGNGWGGSAWIGGVVLFMGASGNTIGGTAAGAGNVISGNTGDGVEITDSNTSNNTVAGNLIGTDYTGTASLGNSNSGVDITSSASSNTIGGTPAAARNNISKNTVSGVLISAAANNVVEGNDIGTDATGTLALGNGGGGGVLHGGVVIANGSTGNTIGGLTTAPGTAPGNVISGNSQRGVSISDASSRFNVVEGNLIGTDATGTLALSNGDGVDIVSGASTNTIGGTTAGARNVIAASTHCGVLIDAANANVVEGNYIGTDSTGAAALGNNLSGDTTSAGVKITNAASNNMIGAAGAGNVISGNIRNGVEITGTGTSNNTVDGNDIGSDFSGTSAVPNTLYGVSIEAAASNNTIGGSVGNVISGNTSGTGLIITGTGTMANIVSANRIGTDVTGSAALANYTGLQIVSGASNNTIGGAAANVISGNQGDGVFISNAGTTGNLVEGNLIGTNAAGSAAVGNWNGVEIGPGAQSNTIGGLTATPGTGFGNVISGDWNAGVYISGVSASSNTVEGNLIGTNAAGTTRLFGQSYGVWITQAASSNTIGGTTSVARNVISGNSQVGVCLSEASTSNNTIAGNYIGTDITGLSAIANWEGVLVATGASSNTIGGFTATPGTGLGNVISGNQQRGVEVTDSGTSGNAVRGNLIGLGSDGSTVVANPTGVFIWNSASGNVVGGDDAADGSVDGQVQSRNVIVATASSGIAVMLGSGGNQVAGNYVGTDRSGLHVPGGTQRWGIYSYSGASTIGGTTAGAGNVVAGSELGVYLRYASAAGAFVQGNFIGLSADGAVALPNEIGIEADTSNLTIGGTTAAARNVISGNTLFGILISDDAGAVSGTVVQGNYIGTNPAGAAPLPNGSAGVFIRSTGLAVTSNTIGGTAAGARNVISGNASDGVVISGLGASNNTVAGNYIGTNDAGTGILGNSTNGVRIDTGASGNTIGGLTATPGTGPGNVISANSARGVFLSGTGTSNNIVEGNLIGPDLTGGLALGNGDGVDIASGASSNTIGGTAATARNLISGNTNVGVAISDSGTTGNVVAGNSIGTKLDGTDALGNAIAGVEIMAGASGNSIGNQAAGVGNVISGNGGGVGAGVYITDPGTTNNTVVANFIGTDKTGTAALANGYGVCIVSGASSNHILGTVLPACNVISANLYAGILIDGANNNDVEANFIGTDVNGTAALGNGRDGVQIANGASGNIVGGTATSARNVISSNVGDGVDLTGPGTSNNTIEGNFIGIDLTGSVVLGHTTYGVHIENQASNNTIGGFSITPGTGAGNVISGNTQAGVNIYGAGTTGNLLEGNLIGTDAAGSAAKANGYGVVIWNGAATNTIGGTTTTPGSGAGNVISGNTGVGVQISDASTTGNLVEGNLIGTDATGTAALPNLTGVYLYSAHDNTIGGFTATPGTGLGNVISGNTNYGIGIDAASAAATRNMVQGNLVGLGRDGSTFLPNHTGVMVGSSAASNIIGGDDAADGATDGVIKARNVIVAGSSPGDAGIFLYSGSNTVEGNYVGTDRSGLHMPGSRAYCGISTYGGPNTIGGTTAGAGNVVAGCSYGVFLQDTPSSGSIVQGNSIGTDMTGTAPLGNTLGIWVASSSVTIGGTTPGARNLISGNTGDGIKVDDFYGDEHGIVIEGNYIGTGPTGSTTLANGGNGVTIATAFGGFISSVTIGGTTSGAANVISGNAGNGVEIKGPGALNNLVEGNFIGTSATVTPLGNTGDGVLIDSSASNNTIGGIAAGAANTIADNSHDGVQVVGNGATGNTIRGNSIHGNTVLGIELGSSGTPSTNILDGSTTGPNDQMNYPVLTVVSYIAGTGTTLAGNINTTPSTQVSIDLYTNSVEGLGGYGQGQTYVGSVTVTTSNSGDASFTFTSASVPPHAILSATATAAGNTSEFSHDLAADTQPTAAFVAQDASGAAASTFHNGQTITFDGSGSISPDGDSLTYTWDFDDGTSLITTTDPTKTVTHTYPYDGAYVPTLIVDDGHGGSESAIEILTITKTNPTIALDPLPASIAVGTTLTVSGTINDPAPDLETVVIAWGDGSNPTTLHVAHPAAGASRFSASHTYASPLPGGATETSIAARVTDASNPTASPPPPPLVPLVPTPRFDVGGLSGSISVPLTVSQQSPTVSLTPDTTSLNLGDTMTLSGTIADPNLLLSHTVTIQWGDTPTATTLFMPPGVLSFVSTHPYESLPSPGSYPINVTVVNSNSLSGSASTSVAVVDTPPVVQIQIQPLPAGGSLISLVAEATAAGTQNSLSYQWILTQSGVLYATGTGQTLTFTSVNGGVFLASVVVTDRYGLTGTASDQVVIGPSTSNNTIDFDPASGGQVTITTNGTTSPPFDPGNAVVYQARGAANLVDASNLTVPVELVGSTGGENTLIGGAGNDTLVSVQGNDHLVGGTGNTTFVLILGHDPTLEAATGINTIDLSKTPQNITLDLGSQSIQTVDIQGDEIHLQGTFQKVIAGPGNDLIYGGAGNTTIQGGSGNATLVGGGGNDIIYGGTGNTTIQGGGGSATLVGGGGNDIIYGGTGNTTIQGGSGNATIVGGGGNDIIYGGTGNATIQGGTGSATIVGGGGNDIIYGGTGNATIQGGTGSATIVGGGGNDVIYGGTGNTTVSLQGGAGNATIVGGGGNDIIYGGTGNTTIQGGTGNATIAGGGGADIIYGGTGNTTIQGGSGSATIVGGGGNDIIYGGTGNTSLVGGTGNATVVGGGGNDIIYGGTGTTTVSLQGGTGSATIVGGGGNDIIYGGTGTTTVSLQGGTGSATIVGGGGNDIIYGGTGNTTIQGGSGNATIVGGGGNDIIYGGTGSISVQGGAGNATIVGGGGNDIIYGGTGNATITGGTGNATIVGGAGNDIIYGGAKGNDSIVGGTGNATIVGGGCNDIIYGGTGSISVQGGTGNATIVGGGGNDIIYGGTGNATITGGTGNATIVGGAGNDIIYGGAKGSASIVGGAGNATIVGGGGNDIIYGGTGTDSIVGGTGHNTISGGGGNDIIYGGPNDWLVETDPVGNAATPTTVTLSSSSLSMPGYGTDTFLTDNDKCTGFQNFVVGLGAGKFLLDATALPKTVNMVLVAGTGDDTILAGPGDDTVYAGSGNDSLEGGGGNDTYVFGPRTQGNVTIDEGSNTHTTLDFSLFGTAVSVDLQAVGPQNISPGVLTLTLTNPSSVDQVVGSALADTLLGNGRNDTLIGGGGSDILNARGGAARIEGYETQVVYLDFLPGAVDYSAQTTRDAIEARLGAIYSAFNYVFTQTQPTSGPFETLHFNMPAGSYLGGEATELDWRHLDRGGSALVDISQFLGGSNEPANTPANVINMSATIAAHELGHLAGLFHGWSFGPIGAGIYANLASNPYLNGFRPPYPGPASAAETRYHVMGSPASVGTSLFDAATVTFFGEREAIAMAFADSGTTVNQVAGGTNTSILTAQPVTLAPLNVPNTLLTGLNTGDTFHVTAADVVGAITLDTDGQSNANYYAISATAGELLTFQVLSQALTRDAGNAIDSVLTIYDSAGSIIPYYNSSVGAFDDDGFQNADAVLLDVPIQTSGTYYLKVSTYSVVDSFGILHNSDIGAYDLFMYSFAATPGGAAPVAFASAHGDTLIGGSGHDTLVGSSANDLIEIVPGDTLVPGSGSNFVDTLPYNITIPDPAASSGGTISLTDTTISLTGTFVAPGAGTYACNWHVTSTNGQVVDHQETTTVSSAQGTGTTAFEFSPTAAGAYTFTLTITDGYGGVNQASLVKNVGTATPMSALIGNGAPQVTGSPGAPITFTGSTNKLSSTTSLDWKVTVSAGSSPIATGSGATFTFAPPASGSYVVTLTAVDAAGAQAVATATVVVPQALPVVQIVGAPANAFVPEGSPFSLSSLVDNPAPGDTLSWSITASDGSAVPFTVTDSGVTCTPDDIGTVAVTLKLIDANHQNVASASQSIVVIGVAPTATISGDPVGGTTTEGTLLTFTGSATSPSLAARNRGFYDTWSVSCNGYPYGEPTSSTTLSVNPSPFSFTPGQAGNYVVSLSVTDCHGFTSVAATRSVSVAAVLPSVSVIGLPIGSVTQGSTVSLNSTVTSPSAALTSAGFATTWTVRFAGATYGPYYGPALELTLGSAGDYTVALTATDAEGVSATATDTITAIDTPPVVKPAASPTSSPPPQASVTAFDLGSVTGPGLLSSPGTASVDWGDGTSATAMPVAGQGVLGSATHAYQLPGTYTVTVTVTDANGLSGSATFSTTVQRVAPAPRILDAPATMLTGPTVSLGSSVVDASQVETNLGFKYHWSVLLNGAPYTLPDDPPISGASFPFAPVVGGTYTINLTATDASGTIGTAAPQTIVVNATTVTQVSTTVSGVATSTAAYGQTVTLTATVTASPWETPTGTVTFSEGCTVLGTASLSMVGTQDQATFSTSALTVSGSPHAITAVYIGHANDLGSTSSISLLITPATLTIMPDPGQSKLYGAAVPAVAYTFSGLVNNDQPALVAGTPGTTATMSSPVGNYAFTLGNVSAGSNYTVAMVASPPTFAVTPATLTIMPDPGQSRLYGAAVPAVAYTISGLVNNDQPALVAGTPGTTATMSSPVGNYPFTLGNVSAGSNYTVAMVASPPTFAVTPATLTIMPNPGQSKLYGAAVPAVAYTFSGLVNNDQPALVAGTPGTTATMSSPVGNYAFTLGNVSAGSNYTVAMVASPPTFAVTPATLTITANDQTKVYGAALPVLTYSVSGFVNGDPSSVLSGSPSLTTTATASSPVGTYPVAVAKGSLTAANYRFTFVNGTLTITAASLAGSIYVLDPTVGGALTLSGNAGINTPGNVVVDSSASNAILATGNARVTAASVQIVGGVSKSGNASVTKTGTPSSTVDPLAGLAPPSVPSYPGSPVAENLSGNSTATISPGLYSQITVSGNARLTLNPGTYVIAGGGFSASGNAQVNASGVTFILEGGGFSQTGNAMVSGSGATIFNAGSNYGTGSGGSYGPIILNGNGSLTAPATGSYAGILIFQSRDNTQTVTLSGNAILGLTGTIYAPVAQLVESGNAQLGSTQKPLTIVVDRMTLSGNAIAAGLSLTPPPGTSPYTPAQIRSAYGISSLALDGTGQTIAIVDAYDNPAITLSLDAFDSQFGLTSSGPTLYQQYGPASSFLTVVNQSGQPTSLPAIDPSGPGVANWEVEEALDVEWAHAIAPGARIVLVEASSQSFPDLMAAVVTAAHEPGVSVVSMSWGFPEGLSVFASDETTSDRAFDVPGLTFVASTGDYGAADPEYPAYSPNVVAVGGTSLALHADTTYQGEIGWGYTSSTLGMFIGSGGGLSLYEPEPAYQQGIQSTGSRTTPDVSLVADPATGTWIADAYNLDPANPFQVVGGTSLSAPAWGGLLALANQGRADAGQPTLNSASPTEAQQALYSLSQTDYHVITSGSNGYTVHAGYNLVTGLGTPVADRLVAELVAYAGPGTTSPGPAVAPLQDATRTDTGTNGGGPIKVFSVFNFLTVQRGVPGAPQLMAPPRSTAVGQNVLAMPSLLVPAGGTLAGLSPGEASSLPPVASRPQRAAASLREATAAPPDAPNSRAWAAFSRAPISGASLRRASTDASTWFGEGESLVDTGPTPALAPSVEWGQHGCPGPGEVAPSSLRALWDEALLSCNAENDLPTSTLAAERLRDPAGSHPGQPGSVLESMIAVSLAVALWGSCEVRSRKSDRRLHELGRCSRGD